ncbi:hypothetical protein C7G83_10385 [Siccibacter turicensis]|uniref:Uncharacterized protein n=1 Tax=Siccibacter turicensis TaxID=357233 RepID=A0A2P8VJ10_9ENTR|nr:hypothetical protein C7G83_10385 [Siccibacter turicensis]
MAKCVRNLCLILFKIVLFVILFCFFASVIDTSGVISYEVSSAFAAWLYGISTQENVDDLWFFSDVLLSLVCALISCMIILTVLRKKIN